MTDVSLRYLLFGEDRSASSAIKGTGTAAQKTSSIVRSSFSKLGSAVGGPIGEIVDKIDSMFDTLGEHSSTFGQKMTAGGVGLAGLGAGLSILGSKEKESTNSLQAALGTTGHSIDDYKSQIEETIKTQENYNHSAADTQNALATLTEATGDPIKAFDNMQLVADLAAAKHIDLNSAAQMVARTLGGSTRLMTQYGISVITNADGTKEMGIATDQLAHKLSGQAAASVDSYSGKLKVLETKVHDQISLWGEKFGPALQAGGVALALVGTITQIVANRQLIATTATAAQTAATEAETVATDEAAVSTGVLGTALDALPMVAIVAAIAAVVAGLVIFFTKTKTGQAIVSAALHGIAAAAAFMGHEFGAAEHAVETALHGVQHDADVTVGFVRSHWPLLLAILTGPFGLATLFVATHFHQIESAAGSLVGSVKSHFNDLIGFFGSMPGRVASTVTGMFAGIWNDFRDTVNKLIDGWNSLSFTLPKVNTHIPGVGTIGGWTISTPDIPRLGLGGVLTTAGRVVVGDRGLEELTLPAGAAVRPLTAAERAGGGIGDLGTFTIVVAGEDGRVIQKKLLKTKRENGGLQLGLA